MKTIILAAALLLIHVFFVVTPGAADEYTLDVLEKEALKFATGYTAKGNVPPKFEQADILRRAADIMTVEKKCSAAMSLYKQASIFSKKPDA
ncbi:MAG: hypothetical protein D3924_14920, partial [Candidatus Electrothrix sp. AR4]|nr:hypothetical protein [Candidatus Electrothrix sp. AR4]